MAFNFVVETGTADPDANSYASVDYFNDYVSPNSFAETAGSFDDDDIERALVRATKYLDSTVDWNGDRVDQDSGLRWPRAGVYDQDGFEISDDVIPILLQDAVCEIASYYLNGEDWTRPEETRGFTQLEVDVINLKFDQSYVRPSVPTYIVDMLNALGNVNQGVRPAFKKIIRT